MRRGLAVVLLVLPALGAGSALYGFPTTSETLVEGHAVFTVLEVVHASDTTHVEYAAAVAVLVREVVQEHASFRFPGVLWTNDQYLVDPIAWGADASRTRHPCSGAILATNAGAGVPLRGSTPSNDNATYVESYRVIDPNDHSWDVDRWNWTDANATNASLWTVALLGNDLRSDEQDDGACEGAAFNDGCQLGAGTAVGCQRAFVPPGVRVSGLGSAEDPGSNGWGYPCGNATAPCAALQYNALLYFLLEDLSVNGTSKDHRDGSADRASDVSGCQATTADWPCPDGDDDREGNSHAYNPHPLLAAYDGAGNHGGSDASGLQDVHAVRRIDVYYGVAAPPVARTYRVLDVVGSEAPYHCHAGEWCGPPTP